MVPQFKIRNEQSQKLENGSKHLSNVRGNYLSRRRRDR